MNARLAAFKVAAILTFLSGIFLHVTSIVIGREHFVERVLTPEADMLLTVPMTIAAIVGWGLWRRLRFPEQWQRWAYALLLGYLTLSIFIHFRTFLTRSTDYVLAFPDWYSYPIVVLMLLMLAFVVRLRTA